MRAESGHARGVEGERLPGISGTLVSTSYASRRLAADFAGRLGEHSLPGARRALASWWRREGVRLGPASSLRRLLDAGVAPLLDTLGFRVMPATCPADAPVVITRAHGSGLHVTLVVGTWGGRLDGYFSRAAGWPDPAGTRWAIGFNGREVRLWDITRGWSRAFLDFDIETVVAHDRSLALFWALVRAEALAGLTESVAHVSSRHGHAVRASLREGVREALELLVAGFITPRALARGRCSPARLMWTFEQALTLVYRVLFLLFAESRGLVPTWHPVYLRSYSIDALRGAAERPGRHTGLWETLQAVSRLAHDGCRAGDLIVTPFNGRLFAPTKTPLAESGRLDDDIVARALVAMTTVREREGRVRIAFGDLGVEQLGAVYESVLDYEPAVVSEPQARASAAAPARHTVRLFSTGLRRKSTGTFYTPKDITDYVVRQALEPLTADATPEGILDLKVLDPAMGSGAFLVAACRFLSTAYERAIVRDRGTFAGDITDEDRAGFRRLVAQRCLYGVDVNPMAVQVARLSLWLATLAVEKPLTFLDHHLAVGNSLLGASLDDVASRPTGRASRARASRPLPLFPGDDVGLALTRVLPLRRQLALVPDDSPGAVREKEQTLSRLQAPSGDLAEWRRLADLWCAGWLWDAVGGPVPSRGEFADLASVCRGQKSRLPGGACASRLAHVRRLAQEYRFFHWALEFPEVFYDVDGTPRPGGGFDAVITNPPWDMMRNDSRPVDRNAGQRGASRGLLRFARDAGVYTSCDTGQPNLYQLFIERSLRLTRTGGRVGLIVPWGLVADHGSRSLRQYLLSRCETDVIVGFDNADAVFPIHRGVRFALLSATPGAETRAIRCHFGHRDPAVLDAISTTSPDAVGDDGSGVVLTPELIGRLSGPAMAFPYVRGSRDLRLLERLCRTHPALGAEGGWALRFGRELNATDDRHLMSATGPGLPVVEGKHLEPFRARLDNSAWFVRDGDRLPSRELRRAAGSWRLAYREVASSTNRLTLIAALVPPGCVTVHTVHCLKTRATIQDQAYLCAMLNSFVANYLARMWVTTHVGAGIIARLPVPRLRAGSQRFSELARLAIGLRRGVGGDDDYVRAQAAAARAYGLDGDEYAHVLESFPLVDGSLKQRCLERLARQPGLSPVRSPDV